jgi:hypothetical protein
MNEHPKQPDSSDGGSKAPHADVEMARDLRALRTTYAHGVPPLAAAASSARRRQAPATWREFIVFTMHRTFLQRPWPAVVLVAAVLLAVFVPVSYERTTGSDVTFALSGLGLGADQVADVARQMKAVLGADRVMIQGGSAQRGAFTMRAFVPAAAGAATAKLAKAFADGLAAHGYSASAVTTARRERVSSPLFAYAMQQVIEIRTDGKSAFALEGEIRQRLAEAGIPDASVSVTDEAGDRKIGVEISQREIGDHSTGQSLPEPPELVLTKDGVPLGAGGLMVKVEKRKSDTGTALRVEVRDAGRTALAEVPGADTKSDAEIAASIESQLRQAGVVVHVTVTGGKVRVEEAK